MIPTVRKSSGLVVLDLFCGAGGSSQGAEEAGATVICGINHWNVATRTFGRNHRDAHVDCADISQIDPRRYSGLRPNILVASPECFVAGTLVTTWRGQVPIEEVAVGDIVLTHRLRWRRVVRVQSRVADTVRVSGQGMTPGIETTASHKFWARPSLQVWENNRRRYGRTFGPAEWHAADTLDDLQAFWSSPASAEPGEFPEPPEGFGVDPEISWWLVGRWLGDGSLGDGRHASTVITCGFRESTEIAAVLAQTGANWRRYHKRTAVTFVLHGSKLRDWLVDNFGSRSHSKYLPGWTLAMPERHRRELLAGYVSADGNIGSRRTQCDSVSKGLAVGVRLLAESLGFRSGLFCYEQKADVIEGREVNVRPIWKVAWENADNGRVRAFEEDGLAWSPVKNVAPCRTAMTVYNVEVEEDHSYIADGVTVLNCTNHTTAKNHKQAADQMGLWNANVAAERSRATMWDVPRFAETLGFELAIVENVVESRSWKPFESWLSTMESYDYDHEFVYLNSQFLPPTPQSRDRMYTIFWKRGNRRPDLRFTPPAECPTHGTVGAVQTWKSTFEEVMARATKRNGGKRPDRIRYGLYGAQYDYRCPSCAEKLSPEAYPAWTAIDWSLPSQRIGDRDAPLAEATMARIERGIERYGRGPIVVPLAYTQDAGRRCIPVWEPFPTQTGRAEHGLAHPFLHQLAGHAFERDNSTCRSRDVRDPMRTQTTTMSEGLVFVPLVDQARGGGSHAHPVTDALSAVTAGGNHHFLVDGFVTRNYGNADDTRSRPYTEPFGSVTTQDHHGLVRIPLIDTYHRTGTAVPVTAPFTTATTHDRHGVVDPGAGAVDVNDCGYRMLEPPELQRGMGFADSYEVEGDKRAQVRQLGNAVTPPTMKWLMERCVAGVFA